MHIGYLRYIKLVIGVFHPFIIPATKRDRLNGKFLDRKLNNRFSFYPYLLNIRNNGRLGFGFYLVEPVLNSLTANGEGFYRNTVIINTYHYTPTFCIGKRHQRFDYLITEAGLKFSMEVFHFHKLTIGPFFFHPANHASESGYSNVFECLF